MRLMLACLGWMGMLLVGCDRPSDAAAGEGRLRVVATTTMIGDLVRQIGAERVDLKVIMGPGVDPHTYKPSTSDLGEMSRASLVVYNGLHLEGKMTEDLERKLKGRAVAVTSGIPESRLINTVGGYAAHDPHVWFDATLWALAARTVGEALGKADPAHASEYADRTAVVERELAVLHEELLAEIQTLPESRRVLITSHDAYSYFGRAYGFEVYGLQGISTETEASPTNLRAAVDYIVAKGIPAIFIESSVNPGTIDRVRADCKARGVEVKVGGELYSDAMGSPGEHPEFQVETYAGMFRYNVRTMVQALK